MSTPSTGSLWRIPALRSMTGLAALAFTSFFLTLSALPLWASQGGTGAGDAGLVTTVMLGCTIAVQTLVPALAGRFGMRSVLVVGLVALGVPAPLYLLRGDLWWLLVVSGVRGCGFGVITVLLPILAGRIAPWGRQGEAIGIYGLAIAVPNLVAVPGAVALTSGGYFGAVAVLSASPLAGLLFVRSVVSGAPAGARPEQRRRSGIGTAIRAITGVVLVLLTVTLAGGGVLTYLPIERPSGALATVALLVFGGTGAIARWRGGVLSDRHGSRVLLPTSVLVAATGTATIAAGLLASDGSDALIVAGCAVLGLGYGLAQALSLMVAFALAGPAHPATASAAWNAAFDAGTALGALLVGALAGTGVGLGRTFAVAALLVAVTIPLAIGAARRAG